MHRVLVASLKGGTGKTTIAVLLARGLRARGFAVGVLDLDVHGPTTAYALGLEAAPRLGLDTEREFVLPSQADGIRLLTLASHFGEGSRITWRGEEKLRLARQLLRTAIDWGDTEWLVIDSPPSQGEELMAILEGVGELHGAILVTQPSDFSVQDSERALDLFREEGMPLVGVVSNMDGCVCPHCRGAFSPFASRRVDIEEFCRERGLPFLMRVPLVADGSLVEYGDSLTGLLLTVSPASIPAGKMVRKIARATARRVLKGRFG